MFQSGRLLQVQKIAIWGNWKFLDVSSKDVEEIKAVYARLQNPDSAFSADAKRLALQLRALKELSSAPIAFLGYFAILESLLTHMPKPSDPYDSITRQIKKKLILLNNRWNPKIDYSAFGKASPESVWSKMYDYRSRLAHGGEPKFEGELKLLNSHDAALTLLRETVKATIRQTTIEPQLVADLRDC